MSGLLELAERCEAATGEDEAILRTLNAEILRALGWCSIAGVAIHPDGHSTFSIPDMVASLDAAMTLVPEGHEVVVGNDQAFCYAAVAPRGTPDSPAYAGSTMTLALCSAALRARHAQEGGGGEWVAHSQLQSDWFNHRA